MGKIFRYSIFRGFPKMNERCAICDLKFEREEGYFLGAMYISYGFALVVITVFSVVVWLVTRASIERVVLIAFLLFLPLTPALSIAARVAWIHMDRAIDPDRKT